MTEHSTEPELTIDRALSAKTRADQLIASLGGDARAAVIQLVALVGALQRENESLTSAASRGYARVVRLR